jgi:hypothetical protein
MKETENGTRISRAPWNDAEKAALNKRQNDEMKHPYTCECGRNLFATHNGWCCVHECAERKIGPFIQNSEVVIMKDWAHQSDIDDYIEKDDLLCIR